MTRRAALLLAGALLAASCGGPPTIEALFGEGGTYATIRMEVPPGWASLEVHGRIILAEREAELNSRPATGSRLTVDPLVLDPADAAMTMLPPGSGDSGALRILTEPQSIEVAGIPAVDVVVEDSSGEVPFVRRYMVIYYAGTASLIVAEAPADRWDRVGPMLDELLQRTLEIGL